jgi:hypothetical protein
MSAPAARWGRLYALVLVVLVLDVVVLTWLSARYR